MNACSLLFNLLIGVALFLGKVSFDLKVDTTGLQSTNKTSAVVTMSRGNTHSHSEGMGYGEVNGVGRLA